MKLKKCELKEVWVGDELWQVEGTIQPTECDAYLLLSQTAGYEVHEDGTTPIDMILIDVHNDKFYPSTEKIDKIMRQRQQQKVSKKEQKEREILQTALLETAGSFCSC